MKRRTEANKEARERERNRERERENNKNEWSDTPFIIREMKGWKNQEEGRGTKK